MSYRQLSQQFFLPLWSCELILPFLGHFPFSASVNTLMSPVLVLINGTVTGGSFRGEHKVLNKKTAQKKKEKEARTFFYIVMKPCKETNVL